MGWLLRNVRPVGFTTGQDSSEIAISDAGIVLEEADPGFRTVDCGGAYISPGWADLHVHVWFEGTNISVTADEAGLASGVTAMADAGSAGEASFHGLRERVIEPQPETIRAFVNISSIGLIAGLQIPELFDPRLVNVDRTLEVIETHREAVCGVKVRASGDVVGHWGITPVRIAKQVAEMAGLPLMVHIGSPPPLLSEVFDLLTPGDVVTHCFNGRKAGSITDTPELLAGAKRLAETGVRMDVGHGVLSFDFTVAERAIAEGVEPFSVSTDLHVLNIRGPVHDLATTVSKLHAAGLDFERCVGAISCNPRGYLGLGESTRLAAGERADFTIFDFEDCEETVEDCNGNRRTLCKMFEPRYAVLGSHLVHAARRSPRNGSEEAVR